MMPSRRRFLHTAGALAAALGAPTGRARAAALPRRLVVVVTPNGFLRDGWLPTGGERDFRLGSTMAPLEPLRDQLIVVDGLYNQAAARSRGPAGERGLATLLTGRERRNGGGNGPSLDQAIAALPGGDGRPTLQLGVATQDRPAAQVAVSFLPSGQALLPEADPLRAQQRLLRLEGVARTDRATAAALVATEKNLALVRRSLATNDARTLENHLAGVAELRRRVTSNGSLCTTLSRPPAIERDTVQAIAAAQIEVVVQALACDAARVATLVFEGASGNARYFGEPQGHRDLALAARTDPDARARLAQIERAQVDLFAQLLRRLQEPDGNGRPLLDSTLVLLGSDVAGLGAGGGASFGPMPFLLAGRAGQDVSGGRFLRYSPRPHNDLLLSIYNLFGGAADSFGPRTTGPLPGLFG